MLNKERKSTCIQEEGLLLILCTQDTCFLSCSANIFKMPLIARWLFNLQMMRSISIKKMRNQVRTRKSTIWIISVTLPLKIQKIFQHVDSTPKKLSFSETLIIFIICTLTFAEFRSTLLITKLKVFLDLTDQNALEKQLSLPYKLFLAYRQLFLRFLIQRKKFYA